MNFCQCFTLSAALLFCASFFFFAWAGVVERNKEHEEWLRAAAKYFGECLGWVVLISLVAIIVGLLGVIWSAWK